MIPENVPAFDDDSCERDEWHSVVTIQLGELAESEWFDLSKPEWDFGPKYSAEQHKQLCDKITNHYWYREIALTPPGVWKREFLRKLNEIMPKYIPLYKLLDEGYNLGAKSEYYKSRNVYSDFPQTSLAGNNQDYASTGSDTEYERIQQLSPIDLYEKIKEYQYQDIDLMIINELESLFSCLFTVNVNGF